MWRRKYIFSPLASKLGLIVNYLDVGARGDVGPPWSDFAPEALKVIGFEPDPVECERLAKTYPTRRYYPNALWGEKATRPFYLNEWGSTSSMYPPNELRNKLYMPQHWKGRVPAKTLSVDCTALDQVLSPGDTPDFIKIDTQGAELEILKGATELLTRASPLVIAETWCTEVYAGMPLTQDVMHFMSALGYEVFDINVAAAWQHKNTSLGTSNGKARTIGFDLLFIKRLDALNFASTQDMLKFAGLCELFGFRDYAIAALEQAPTPTVDIEAAIAEMIGNDKWERSLSRRLQALLFRVLRRDTRLHPPLH